MPNLYLNESGTVVGFSRNCFTVSHKNGLIRKIPSETLESISIFGSVQMTAKSVEKCLRKGIDVSYYSKGGSYFGRLISTNHVNTARQRSQIKMTEDDVFKLNLSKSIIQAKLNNQLVILRRYQRNSEEKNLRWINEITQYLKKIENCTHTEQLMGYEGSAAKAYFSGLAGVIDKKFLFRGRSRRPPRDPFNSMLSLGYSILMNEIYGEIENRGLNPYFGFLHKDREKHPTLASDLMEEWRAVIVDAVVMSLINGHEILPEHFYTESDREGVFLNKEGIRIFISKLEKKFLAQTKYLPYVNYPVTFRRAIGMQAGRLADAIEKGDTSVYLPVRIR